MLETATVDDVDNIRENLSALFRCSPDDIEVSFDGFIDRTKFHYEHTEFYVGPSGPDFLGVRVVGSEHGELPVNYLYEYMRGIEPDYHEDDLTLFL